MVTSSTIVPMDIEFPSKRKGRIKWNRKTKIIVTIIIILIVIGIILYFVLRPKPTKYSCVNNVCVEDSKGKFANLDDCVKSGCKKPPPPTKYSCVNNVCVEDSKGKFSSLDDCIKSCKKSPSGLNLPKPLPVRNTQNLNYYNLSNYSFDSLKSPKSIKDCLTNYFLMLYPSVDPKWWQNMSENDLRCIYNMLDWFYTPLVLDPKLPYPLNSVEEIKSLQDLKNDRVRPIVAPYVDAYVQHLAVGGTEPITGNCNNNSPCIIGDPSSFLNPDDASVGWPQSENVVAKPLMNIQYIQPYGKNRNGFPSYAYVELVTYAFESGGSKQRTAPTCNTPYGNSQLSSFDGVLFPQTNTEMVTNAQKYAVAKPYNNISGAGYIGTDPNGWGGPIKEQFTITDKSNPNYGVNNGRWAFDGSVATSGIKGINLSNFNDSAPPPYPNQCKNGKILGVSCICLSNQAGFRWNPTISINSTQCVSTNCSELCILDSTTNAPLNILKNDDDSLRKNATVYSCQNSTCPTSTSVAGYCPDTGYGKVCSASPHELYYPVKGYGKFTNTGKTGVYFSYVSTVLSISDRNGYGINFRYPFETIGLNGGGVSGSIFDQVRDLCGVGTINKDNRKYLMGYITVPLPNSLTNMGTLDKYYEACINNGAGRVDSNDKGEFIFTPKVPQIVWDGKSKGCGQMRWNKGEKDSFTGQTLQCENEWLNPMDDNGRLEYLGKNFAQFYCPPEAKIPNPNYGKTILNKDMFSGDIEKICGNVSGSGSTGNAINDAMQEFAIRWVTGMYVYGDTGQEEINNTFPFGSFSVDCGDLGHCVYIMTGAMGWKTIIISQNSVAGGQGSVCTYPYYDCEVVQYVSENCEDNDVMSNSCGAFGQQTLPNKRKLGYFASSGHTSVCNQIVTLDVSQNINRYLYDNFLPAFVDLSTASDTDTKNKNYKKYNATNIDRSFFTLSEASSDIPAQLSRQLYQPNPSVNYCTPCPADNTINILPSTNWKDETDKLVGQTGINLAIGGKSFSSGGIYAAWAGNATHQQSGCYTVDL